MTVEALPDFSRPARQRWESIPVDIRQRLLANVWCGQCRHEVTITNFSGTIKGGDLLLVGKCAECHGDSEKNPPLGPCIVPLAVLHGFQSSGGFSLESAIHHDEV